MWCIFSNVQPIPSFASQLDVSHRVPTNEQAI